MISKSFFMSQLFIFLLACSAAKPLTKVVPASPVEIAETVTQPKGYLPSLSDLQDTIPPPVFKIDTLISMYFGPCYGKCPIYEITIFNDGTVLKNDLKYTNQPGQYLSLISKDQIIELEKFISMQSPWSVTEYFPAKNDFIADFPVRTMQLKWKNQIKKIIINHSPSPAIKSLEEKVLEWVGHLQWKNISN